MTDRPFYIAGEATATENWLDVFDPYTGDLAGRVALAGPTELERAIEAMLRGGAPLTRHERHEILEGARRMLRERTDEFANLIRLEAGLSLSTWLAPVRLLRSSGHSCRIVACDDSVMSPGPVRPESPVASLIIGPMSAKL